LIALDDVDEAAGMLLGMVAAAPRRAAIFGGQPLPSRSQIEARARTCAALFLRGCPNQPICLVRKLNRRRIRTMRLALARYA